MENLAKAKSYIPQEALRLLKRRAHLLRALMCAIGVLAIFSSTLMAAAPNIPSDAREISYVWKRGDSLSKALYSLGVGVEESGPRLYGRQGWVARNEAFYARKNWDSTAEGSTVVMLTPRAIAVAPEALDTIGVETEPVDFTQPSAPSIKSVRSTTPSKPKPFPQSKDLVLGLMLITFFTLAAFSYRWRQQALRDKKLTLVANSVLTWLTTSGQHSNEHITLATTLFIGDLSQASLDAYEVMGYFNHDIEQVALLKDQLKSDGNNQAGHVSLSAEHFEYLTQYFCLVPEVIAKVLGTATLPFLQIRTLRLLAHFASNHPEIPRHPQLTQSLAAACARYPSLLGNPSVRNEVRATLNALKDTEGPNPSETAA